GLRAREPAEVDRHRERGHLVVGHVAPRVAEHELCELVLGELATVPLALDQLRGMDHAVCATKTTGWMVTTSSPSNGGTSAPVAKSVRDASTYATASSRLGKRTVPPASRISTRSKWRRSSSSPFAALKGWAARLVGRP